MQNETIDRGRSSSPSGSVTADTKISAKLTDATSTYTVVASSKLSEDYIHSTSMLASASAISPLASFLNSSGQSEALLIHDDGELCHLLREPLSGTGWNIVGIGAQIETIVGASSNSMATIGQDNSIWISNAGHWNSVPLPGNKPAVSACQDGTFFGTSSREDGQSLLYQYDPVGAVFTEVSTIPYSTPPVGRVGDLWTVGVGGMVLNNTSSSIDNPSDWFPVSYGGWESRKDIPGAVFVATDNSVWVFCPATKALYTRDTYGSWNPCSVPDRLIAVAPLSANAFYALCLHEDTTRLYLCDRHGNNTVVSQPGDDKTLKSISVGAMDGTLWVLDNIGTAWRNLNGTWVRMIQPTDLAGVTHRHHVTEVVTGQHKLGDQYAFFVMDGNLHWSVFGETEGLFGGYWTVPVQIFSGISDIRAVNDPHEESKLIVYGVSANGNLVVVQSDSKNHWTAVETKMKTSLSGTKPIFNPCNSFWITYAVIDGALHAGVGKLNQPALILLAVKNSPILIKSLIPFSTNPQGIEWTLAAAAVDVQNQIWTIQVTSVDKGSIALAFTALGAPATGAIPNAVGMIASETAGARIYACDQDDLLWVIRQTGFSNATFQWSTWLPLGDECTTLAVGCTLPPPGAPHKPPVDLFSLDSGSEVNVLSEDAITGQLSDLVMLKPAGTNTTPEYVSRYLTEVTVTDPSGVPQPNFQIAVTSDVAVGVWVGQTIYTITPNRPTPLITGPSGTFTFAFFASDLNTPTFFFNADTLVSEGSIYPAQDVQDYLSGKPNVMPGRPDFDSGGKTLLDAQMQTVPNFQAQGGTVPFVQGQSATANAPTAAHTITQLFAIPVSPSGTSGQWSVGGNSSGGLVGGSSIWNDLCKFPHDIDHAIRKDALKVSHIAVDVENKVVHVTMVLANGASQALKLLIHTVQDVVSAVKCAFRYVERAIEEAIDWLKALFNWHDILNTKNIIEAALNGTMTKLADVLNPKSPNSIEAIINRAFSDAEAKITAAFAEAARLFDPNDSFQSTTDSVPYPSGATPIGNDPLNPNSLNSAQASNGTHTNYVQTHTNNYANQGGTFPPLTSGGGLDTDATFQSLIDTVNRNTGDGTSYQTDNASFLSTLRSVFASRQSFYDTIMLDLIDAAKDVVLDVLKFVDKIIQKLLSLAFDAIVGFQKMLTTGIDIPVISWIWKQISDHSLTMLDLFSLGFAVPATLLYKLTFGMPKVTAPFTDDQAQQIVATLNNPQTFPWPILGSSLAAVSTSPFTPAVASSPFTPEIILTLQKVLIAPGAVAFMGTDIFNDFVGWSNIQESGLLKQTTPYAAGGKIIGGVLLRFALIPTAVLKGIPITTEVDGLTLLNWSVGFSPFIALLALALRPSSISGFGMMVASVIGTCQFGVAVATIVGQALLGSKVPYTIARNLIAPLPNMAKPILKTPGEPQAAIAFAAVGEVDSLCDLAVGALALCAVLT